MWGTEIGWIEMMELIFAGVNFMIATADIIYENNWKII